MIRPADILFYGGGECLQKFAVPFMGVNKRQRVAPTYTRNDTVARFFDRSDISRLSSTNRVRVEWANDVPYLQNEMARTNVVLWNRDLTNAAWTKSNCTVAKDQTGIDGVANSASKITATADTATCLQNITLASSARFQSAYVKRVAGSGIIEMTMDNGLTWTAITVTSSWTRVAIPTQTLANPIPGFLINTNGDAIAVDFVQNEAGAEPSSPIATTTASVTREAETCYVDYLHVPQAHSGHVRFTEGMSPTWGSNYRILEIADASDNTPKLLVYRVSGADTYAVQWNTGSPVLSTVDLNPTRGDDVELFWWQFADGSVQIAGRKNSGSITTGTASGALSLSGQSFSAKRFYLSHPTESGNALYRAIKMARGSDHSTDDLANLFAWETL